MTQQQREIHEALLKGIADQEIADTLGCCTRSVQIERRRMGIVRQKLNIEHVMNAFLELTTSNKPYTHIALDNGLVTRQVMEVARWCRNRRVTFPRRAKPGRPRKPVFDQSILKGASNV